MFQNLSNITSMPLSARNLDPTTNLLNSYVLSDGFYSKVKWVDGVTSLGLAVISKLLCDASLQYVYTGEQKPRGRKRK
ncbi:hypothetical protein [Pseudanabaena mucicola]|uniref:hypothetical protein n=1 Tax=Pseudanabaena mucicola TaxID=71190 RepID=UPI0025772882|nr:hypothetical protein [Pseudanabaena mucicola]